MAMRDDWKETGKGLGNAFSGLGKSVIKSAKIGADKADTWANGEQQGENPSMKEMWKETGSGLGHAFEGLGKTTVKAVKTGADKADSWASGDKHQAQDVAQSSDSGEAETVEGTVEGNPVPPTEA